MVSVRVVCDGYGPGSYVPGPPAPRTVPRLSRMSNRKSANSEEIQRRIEHGAVQGGELTRKVFAEHITRKRFCDQVGIHRNTLKKWEKLGIVEPQFVEILKSRTAVFNQEDVERGKQIAALIADNAGTLTVKQAAALVDTKLAKRRP